MLRWLRNHLSDVEGVEQRVRAELQTIRGEQERLSRLLYVIEQRLDTIDKRVCCASSWLHPLKSWSLRETRGGSSHYQTGVKSRLLLFG